MQKRVSAGESFQMDIHVPYRYPSETFEIQVDSSSEGSPCLRWTSAVDAPYEALDIQDEPWDILDGHPI